MPPHIPSIERIAFLHAETIRIHGGEGTVTQRALDCVQSKVDLALLSSAYVADESDPDVFHFAAYLLHYLVSGHCFVDGNKRVGWLTMVDVLLANDIDLVVEPPIALATMERVARGELDALQIVQWLVDHAQPRSSSK